MLVVTASAEQIPTDLAGQSGLLLENRIETAPVWRLLAND